MKREYKMINQKPYCCLAAALQMIMERNNIDYPHNQERLLDSFEKSDLNGDGNFRFPIIKDLNKQFFEPKELPFKEIYHSYREITDYDGLNSLWRSFNRNDHDYIMFGNFVMFCNDYSAIKQLDIDPELLDVRHVFLISEIIDENHVMLVSPDTDKNGGTQIIQTTFSRIENCFEYSNDPKGFGYSAIIRTDK